MGITLLLGGGAGILAEAELDSKRVNAEKIYEELVRRREQKMKGSGKRRKNKGKKKRQSGMEKKRLAAISEVIMEDTPDTTVETAVGIPVAPEAGAVDDSADDESPA